MNHKKLRRLYREERLQVRRLTAILIRGQLGQVPSNGRKTFSADSCGISDDLPHQVRRSRVRYGFAFRANINSGARCLCTTSASGKRSKLYCSVAQLKTRWITCRKYYKHDFGSSM
jgi:hypothetical protein